MEEFKRLLNTNISYIYIKKRRYQKYFLFFVSYPYILDNPIRKFVKSHGIVENIL